ncbi:intersectin-1 isoform X1 [Drosophila novamexicana]|uniref:intersectin-1 isoform X1 n=1 Tax=Drosophila novamexicana TaxID=47314 RepID=UPI0011E5FA7E|nr:intersectin-1 isoform X1 [Drosophila novamexicana]XP_030569046.1 intersectin-1 isoform X1 [Drosophila novamexicana]
MNPAVDAWAVTQREKLKYQEQFKALQPQGGFVTGAQAKGFFLQSQLPPLILGQIWALADTDSDGKMNINEFSIACKLINLKLRGLEVPKTLPPTLLSSLTDAAAIGGPTPTMTPRGSTSSMSPMDPLKSIAAAVPPAVPVAIAAPPIVVPPIPAPVPVPVVPIPVAVPAAIVSPPQSNPSSRHMSISERAPSIESPQGEWAVQAAQKRKYTQVFNANDRTRSGYLTGAQARGVLVQSKLPQVTLAQIWTLADVDGDGRLSCDEFILAMFLCEKAMAGEKIPVSLPLDWVPPSLRKINKSRPGSVSGAGSRPGSQPASRHTSVSSQGAVMSDADPLAGLPQTSFEDKRKENYEKGKVELDRRRKLMEDQQRKEREERERKEREEADKREKARLEAERKQQEELERQLQRQREIEQEKEEQRKRELEAKEAARKELEKQRQQEWEQARIAEMNAQKQREQERVLKQKAHNTQLNVELSTLNERIKDLSQKICDTRAGVTNVKSVIDGMRTQRDTSMSEMAQLKVRIKEQNAKLLQLTQERAKWDAKSKSSGGIAGDTTQQEQLNAAFAHKQLLIKQIKDKVVNIEKEIESKKEDLNSNDVTMQELKAELAALITKCENLYKEYDVERTAVLELKYNRKNEAATISATSAWDTGSAWGGSAASGVPAAAAVDAYAGYGLSIDTVAAADAVVDLSGPAPEGFVKYRAVYEFNARNAEEITFVPGDIILVPLEQNAEPGWLAGEINGHTGWFPESYVEKLEVQSMALATAAAVAVPDVVEPATQTDSYLDNNALAAQPELATATVAAAAAGDVEYYIAAYPYESAEEGDLSFGAGEMVMVIKKEGEWWTGTIGNRTGMFPSNYVQKADVGTATAANAVPTAVEPEPEPEPIEQEVTPNGINAVAAAAYAAQPEAPESIQPQAQSQPQAVELEESHTIEDLDIEVSQINTQNKTQSEPAESYSRPMSRTSSMTPGMRAKRSEIAQVIAPYEATSTEQLSLTRGQLIMIRKKTDSGWWEGELQAKGRRRQIGWFPATYVKVLQGGRNSGRNTPVSGSRIEMTEQILDKVIALYPYKAQNDDELSFDKDDIISVLGRDEPEWWRGELNGLSGLFPSNYVGPFVTSVPRLEIQAAQQPAKSNQIARRPLQRLWQHWRQPAAAPSVAIPDERLRGKVQSVHITKRSNGQLMGCAYVTFECNELMARAMLQEDQDNRLLGRDVIMDWQLPKKRSSMQWRCWC